MPVYVHTSGERVDTPADSREGRRLTASDQWSEVPAGPAPAKRARRRPAVPQDGEQADTPPDPSADAQGGQEGEQEPPQT